MTSVDLFYTTNLNAFFGVFIAYIVVLYGVTKAIKLIVQR